MGKNLKNIPGNWLTSVENIPKNCFVQGNTFFAMKILHSRTERTNQTLLECDYVILQTMHDTLYKSIETYFEIGNIENFEIWD